MDISLAEEFLWLLLAEGHGRLTTRQRLYLNTQLTGLRLADFALSGDLVRDESGTFVVRPAGAVESFDLPVDSLEQLTAHGSRRGVLRPQRRLGGLGRRCLSPDPVVVAKLHERLKAELSTAQPVGARTALLVRALVAWDLAAVLPVAEDGQPLPGVPSALSPDALPELLQSLEGQTENNLAQCQDHAMQSTYI